MRITERYASAIKSSNLKTVAGTTYGDTDVLGAYGIADRRLSLGINAAGVQVSDRRPFAVPLQRLLMGDGGAAVELVDLLAQGLRGQAKAAKVVLTACGSQKMARAVIAYFRNSACPSCGGHGFEVVPGSNALGVTKCGACEGTGKVQIIKAFRQDHRELVRWAMDRVEEESARAGPAAMKAIADKMEF
jgi:hypothetical protein